VSATDTAAAEKALAEKAAATKAATEAAAKKDAADRVVVQKLKASAIPAASTTTPLDYSKWDNLDSDTDSSPRSLSPIPRRGEEAEEEVQVAPKPEQINKKKAKKKKKKKSGVYTESDTKESALRSAVLDGDLAGLQRALDQMRGENSLAGGIEWSLNTQWRAFSSHPVLHWQAAYSCLKWSRLPATRGLIASASP
jgi:hypothetical protein